MQRGSKCLVRSVSILITFDILDQGENSLLLFNSLCPLLTLFILCPFISLFIVYPFISLSTERLKLFKFYWQEVASVNSKLLLMAAMALLFLVVLLATHTELHFEKSKLALSRFSSCAILVAYVAYLYFQLKSQQQPCDQVS